MIKKSDILIAHLDTALQWISFPISLDQGWPCPPPHDAHLHWFFHDDWMSPDHLYHVHNCFDQVVFLPLPLTGAWLCYSTVVSNLKFATDGNKLPTNSSCSVNSDSDLACATEGTDSPCSVNGNSNLPCATEGTDSPCSINGDSDITCATEGKRLC
jgi:hypothetical protein